MDLVGATIVILVCVGCLVAFLSIRGLWSLLPLAVVLAVLTLVLLNANAIGFNCYDDALCEPALVKLFYTLTVIVGGAGVLLAVAAKLMLGRARPRGSTGSP